MLNSIHNLPPAPLPSTMRPCATVGDATGLPEVADHVTLSTTDGAPATQASPAAQATTHRQEVLDALAQLPPSMPLKIYLVHGSHTGGHRAAAEAVKAALDQMPNVHAEVINALDFTGEGLKGAQVAATDFAIHQAAAIRGWAFRKSFEGNPVMYWLGNTGMKMKAFMSRSFLHKIQGEKPDAILSCHSPMNSMLAHWKRKGEFETPLHSVVTDFRAHRMWAQEGVDHYYLASEQVRQDLEKFGMDPARLEVSGIPIDPKFAAPHPTREEARTQLGLDPALPTVLMMGGSLGLGRFGDVAKALAALPTPIQMVCITGRNEARKQELEALQKELPMPMRVVGYTSDVDRYMDAADVIVSKPGGLTTSEVFAKQVPMVIMDAMAGLEQMLVPSIVATGGAMTVQGAQEAAACVESLVEDPARREAVSAALARVGKPHAAETVALELVEAALAHRGLSATP